MKRKLRDFPVTEDALLPVGTSLNVRHFVPGQYVDITGITKGKGFQGGMKRHGFKGMLASHGASLSHRSIGSTGQRDAPGKVFKGKKMPGRMGGEQRTVKNVWVYKICPARNLMWVKGQLKQETLASPPPPQGLPPSVALRHYHRRLVVRASSSFKNRSFFFLELGASVSGIHLLHCAPATVRRALSHHRLRLVVADSSNPPPSSELCSSPGLCLRHDSAPLFSDCSEEKPISIPVSFFRVQRAEAQPRKKP
ncbi:50S ribosomal protein-2 [Arachis hypogaea]|nr:50S ribosomal protein-2 [Arachis hypogaea]